MKNLNIDNFYKKIYPLLASYEQKRIVQEKAQLIASKRIKENNYFVYLGAILTGLGLTFVFYDHGTTNEFTPIVIVLVGVVYYLLKRIFHYQPKIEDFIPAAKKELKKEIIKAIDPNFKYTAHPELLKTEYWNGQFHRKADNFYLRDRIFGKIGQIYFESLFANVSIEVRETDDDGHSYTRHETIFRGFFMRANYPKKFKGEIIISPDSNESVWGTYISRKIQARKKKLGKLVYLENPEFERHFKVYCKSDDEQGEEIVARYILSPAMMEVILNLNKKVNCPIYLSFINSKVYLEIDNQQYGYHLDLKNGFLDKKMLEDLANQIYNCLGFIEDLRLDSRI